MTKSEMWRPTASWEMLRWRAALLRRLREFFESRGFVEVNTPLLSADTVADLHIDPIPVTLPDDARSPLDGPRLWLQTSPEFHMKRLLAAGAERIYQVTHAFRAGERGSLHNPEFTIVEWYRVGDDMQAGMQLLAELAMAMLAVDNVEQLSYEAAFQRQLQLNPHTASVADLAAITRRRQLSPPQGLGEDRDAWLNYLLSECIEPHLGQDRPAILFDYPVRQAALARVREVPGSESESECGGGYQVAERFELYVRGVELANGYHELLDADVLRTRNHAANAARRSEGRYEVPADSRLLAAMEHGLPPCSGVALGFDRLVLLATGASSLCDVMPFPIDRA